MDSKRNSASSINESIPSIAFDPKSPSTLLIAHHSNDPTDDSDFSTETKFQSSQFQFLSSDDGTGCNAEETQCLMRLIDVHNNSFSANTDYQNVNQSSSSSSSSKQDSTSNTNSRKLSQAYRKQIIDCIDQWELRINDSMEKQLKELSNNNNNNNGDKEESDEMKEIDKECRNKDLLKVTHAITHLAEIYLCSNSNNTKQRDDGGIDSFMDFHDYDDDDDNDEFNLQLSSMASTNNKNSSNNQKQMGAVTADTIRYLRYHHLNDISDYTENLLNDEITIEELLESNQPEHWQPEHEEEDRRMNHRRTPYWALVRKLVQRGLLKDAWDVLRSHSACVRAEMKFASNAIEDDQGYGYDHGQGRGRSSFIDQTVREDMEAFMLIQKLFLFAPLPGGRTELNDSCLGENIPEDDYEGEGDDDGGDNWWNGMTSNAHKLWDANDTANDDVDKNSKQYVHDAPSEFNIFAVMNIFNSWKMRVSQALRSNVALRNLTRRIPNLQSCVWDVILSTQESFDDRDDSWAERLVAELLYVRPNIRKDDVSVRAMVHMKHCGILVDDGSMDSIVLEVMRGNAGSVIEALHSLGGASGAALPATMMALLCCVLVDNGDIRLADLSYDLRTENLLSASCAIISSFTMQNHSEIGIRLSTKLLQYYITPENMQITGHVASILSSHNPKSDAEVRAILKICVDAIERGSFRILDACESLCLSRSQFYRRTQSFGSMIGWLIRGIECVSRLGADGREDAIRTDLTRSLNFRQLTRMSYDMASALLAALCKKDSNSDEDISKLVQMTKHCKDAQNVIIEDNMADIISADPSVSLLIHVANIGWGIIEKNNKQVAKSIIRCLEERNDLDGSMIAIAPPKLNGYFLTLAYDILNATNGNAIGDITHSSESFDVNDMQVLLCCLEYYCNGHKYGHAKTSNIREDITLDEVRATFGKGLMRAFVAQNANVREEKMRTRKSKEQQSELLPVNLEQLLGMSL